MECMNIWIRVICITILKGRVKMIISSTLSFNSAFVICKYRTCSSCLTTSQSSNHWNYPSFENNFNIVIMKLFSHFCYLQPSLQMELPIIFQLPLTLQPFHRPQNVPWRFNYTGIPVSHCHLKSSWIASSNNGRPTLDVSHAKLYTASFWRK